MEVKPSDASRLLDDWEKKPKNRLRHAQAVLGPWTYDSPPKAAAYLGYRQVNAFITDLDREYSKAVTGFLQMERTGFLSGLNIIQPNKVVIFKLLDSLDTEYEYLRGAIDESHGSIVVNTGEDQVPSDLSNVDVRNVNWGLSTIAAMRNIICGFPSRFREIDPSKYPEDGFIWDHSHEDWTRALVVLEQLRKRRRDIKGKANKNTRASKDAEMPPFACELRKVPAPKTAGSTQAQVSVDNWAHEMSLMNPYADANCLDLATLGKSSQAHALFGSALTGIDWEDGDDEDNGPSVNEHRVADAGVAASDTFAELWAKMHPSTDTGSKEAANNKPLSPQEVDVLLRGLDRTANVQFRTTTRYDESSLLPATSAAAIDLSHGIISTANEEEAVLEQNNGDSPGTSSEDTTSEEQMEFIRRTRSLVGGKTPEHRDLNEICKKYGLGNWDSVVPSKERPDLRLMPHQIRDADWIVEILESPLRAGILANECGIGKTVTSLFALRLSIEKRKTAWFAGDLKVLEGDRAFKPSVWLCPSATVHQTFQEIRRWFGGYFTVHVVYQNRATVSDIARKHATVDDIHVFQGLVNKWRRESKNPMTANVLVLMSYDTATGRLSTTKPSRIESSEETFRHMHANEDPCNQVPEAVSELSAVEAEREGSVPIDDEDDASDDEEEASSEAGKKKKSKKPREHENSVQELKFKGAMFHWLLADESHFLKSRTAKRHKFAALLDTDAKLFISATPMLNSIRDFMGYSALIWQQSWPFRYSVGESEVGPQFFFAPEVITNLLMDPEGDGKNWEGITRARLFISKSAEFADPNKTERARLRHDEYVKGVGEQHMPLFLLNPHLIEPFAESQQWGVDFAQIAIGPLLNLLQIRRRMLDKLVLPDGSECSPGQDIPPISVSTVELGLRSDWRRGMHNVLDTLHKKMMTPSMNMMSQHLGGGAVQGKQDIRNQVLTHPSVRCLKLLGDMEALATVSRDNLLQRAQDQHKDKGKKHVSPADLQIGGKSSELTVARARKKAAANAKQRPEPAAGVSEMNRIASNDPKSPKYAFTLAEAVRCHQRGERLIIYVTNPVTLQIMNALLVLAGLKAINIKSAHAPAERDAAVAKFNSPSADVDVLITSSRLAIFGVNYHFACHQGIVMEATTNASTTMHVIRRLWRIGQKHAVKWYILYQQSSYDGWIENQQLQKFSQQLASEGLIDPRITGEHRIVCAFEIMAMYFGHRCNRYPRKSAEWHEYDNEKVTKQGQFYSAIARALMANPDLFANMTPSFIKELSTG
ncbi:hypothetical protein ACHAQA_006498 [Verticillium albo-atrum]